MNTKICQKVLTVGPIDSKGGISAVMHSYARIMTPFDCVSTYTAASKAKKWKLMISACLQVAFQCGIKRKKIVHLHSAAFNSFQRKKILAAIARFFGAKTIFHIHNGEFDLFALRYGTEKCRRILCKNAAVIALSDFWKKKMEEVIGLDNIVVINNIVNTPTYPLKSPHRGKINILFLGIICHDKGIFDLVETIAEKRDYYKNHITLTIGGKGEIDKLNALIRQHHLEDFIKFVGWVEGNEKELLIRDSDIYVLPSYHEGMPVSILEAMSYGKPIVATHVGSIPEIVHDGENGYLITPGDRIGLDKALHELINCPDKLNAMGNTSLKLVAPYLDKSIEKQLETLYNKILNT